MKLVKKQIFSLIFFIMFVCCRYVNANIFCNIKLGELAGKGHLCGYSIKTQLNTTFCYKNEEYTVVTTSSKSLHDYLVPVAYHLVTGLAVFSQDRKLHYVEGIKVIDDNNFDTFIGKSLSEFIKKYGISHCDISEECYIPSYVTKNGIIVGLKGNFSSNDSECNLIESIIYWDIIENRFRECGEPIEPACIKYRKLCSVL